MTINVGNVDRIARAILGVVLLYVAFASGALDGSAWQWVAAVAGVVMLAVAAIRFCPVYTLIGIKTCRAA